MVKIKVMKAVGYCRVSSESQSDNTSIDLQVQKIREYCQLYNITLDKIFIDEAKSGTNTDRKEYQDMMEYINQGDINGIVVYKADRVHRKLKNLLTMIDELESIGTAFISITEGFDTSTSQGMLFLQMVGSFSEFEAKVINERTQSGRIAKGKSGKFAGGGVPFGYDLINGDTLVINEKEAETVRTIFQLRKEGTAINKIVTYLNDNGITINNKLWGNSKVDYILKNEVYTGIYSYNGAKEQNNISFTIPKIISKQLYNTVNNQTRQGVK